MTQRGKGGGGKHEALQVDFTQARFMTRCNVLVLNRMAQTSEVCVKKKSMVEGRSRLAEADGVVRGED